MRLQSLVAMSEQQRLFKMKFSFVFRDPTSCWPPLLMISALVCSIVTTSGCGSSNTDLMNRAAMRRRTPDPEPEAETAPPADAANAQAVATVAKSAEMPKVELEEFDASLLQDPSKKVEAEAVAKRGPPELVQKPLPIPISKRGRESIPNEKQSAENAVDGLQKIADAVVRYTAATGSVPNVGPLKPGSREEILSWRVALLPYLGYTELYERFNLQEPWDSPANLRLLPYIPDEFVFPGRPDWKTNICGFESTYCCHEFSEPVIFLPGQTDPIEDTILLAEVDDQYAVPWTKPSDYPLGGVKVRDGCKSARAGGTFVIWADGKVGMVPQGISAEQFGAALTWSFGEKQLAAVINRPIRLEDDLEAFEDNIAQQTSSIAKAVGKAPLAIAEDTTPKADVPTSLEVSAAGLRLREIFHERFENARNDDQKVQLGRELLIAAAKIESSPAEVFAFQNAAISLASAAGNVELLLSAVDDRVGRFAVNSVVENYTALESFGKQNANRPADSLDGPAFLRRSVPLIYATCQQDNYDGAVAIVGYASDFLDYPRSSEIPKTLNQLKTYLVASKQKYAIAKKALAAYRYDSTDGDAAAEFGRFLCFIKGDWGPGLPLVVQGGSSELRQLADLDLKGADKVEQRLVLGDEWWRLSDLAKDSAYKQGARDRAQFWYESVVEGLPESLDQLHVKGRLNENKTAAKTSPMALINRLADQTGVDLETSLRSLSSGARPVASDAGANLVE